jgi:hypothetical protein
MFIKYHATTFCRVIQRECEAELPIEHVLESKVQPVARYELTTRYDSVYSCASPEILLEPGRLHTISGAMMVRISSQLWERKALRNFSAICCFIDSAGIGLSSLWFGIDHENAKCGILKTVIYRTGYSSALTRAHLSTKPSKYSRGPGTLPGTN